MTRILAAALAQAASLLPPAFPNAGGREALPSTVALQPEAA
jgi:hypothetical protein